MRKYVAALALIFALAIYVAVQDQRSAAKSARHRTPPANGAVAVDSHKSNAQKDAENTDWQPPRWHGLFTWPDGITTWAIILTLLAIAEQAGESAKATQAVRDSIPHQKSAADAALQNAQAVINAERAWLDIDFVRTGKSEYEFRVTNYGKTPAFVIWRVLGRTHWDEGIGEIPEGFKGTHAETKALNNVIRADSKPVNILTFDVSAWPSGEQGQSVTYHGQVRYRDIFDQVQRTEIVYSLQQSTMLLVHEPIHTRYKTETKADKHKQAN